MKRDFDLDVYTILKHSPEEQARVYHMRGKNTISDCIVLLPWNRVLILYFLYFGSENCIGFASSETRVVCIAGLI